MVGSDKIKLLLIGSQLNLVGLLGIKENCLKMVV